VVAVVWFLSAAIVAGVYQSPASVLWVSGALAGRALWLRTPAAWGWLLLAAMCASIGWCAASSLRRDCAQVAREAAARGAAVVALDGHVASFPKTSPFGTWFLYETRLDGRRVRLAMRAAFFDVGYGDAFACRARLVARAADAGLPADGAAGSARVRLRDTQTIARGSCGSLTARMLWRLHRAMRTRLSRALSSRAALPLALVLGERGFLDRRLREAVVRLGIAHLLALSGMHLGTVAVLALLAARAFPRGRDALVLAALSLYVGLVGEVESLSRAYLMAVIMVLARALARPVDGIDALGKALLVMLLVEPAAVFSVGLQLSFAATVAVLAVAGRFPLLRSGWGSGRGVRRFVLRGCALVAGALLVSVAVEVVIAPLQFHHFGRLSAVGPLATALFLLPVSLIQVLALAASVLADVPLLGGWLVAGLGAASRVTGDAVVLASAIAPDPVSGRGPLALPYYLALAVVWRFPRRRVAWLAAGLLLALAFGPRAGVFRGEFW
jgi:ComEC/Rec2-related protein